MTSPLPAAVSAPLADYARAAFQARNTAEVAPQRGGRSLEQVLDAQLVLSMAERLSLAELEALGRATELREKGLALARYGDVEQGAALVDEARSHLDGIVLSEEAELCSETFQTAAEAYIRYRTGKADDAIALTLKAISTCQQLQRSYSYQLDLRLAHLGRNIVRVMARSGRSDEAMRLAIKIVCAVDGDAAAWPWPDSGSPFTGIERTDAAWMAIDQLIGEIIFLMKAGPRAQSKELEALRATLALSERFDLAGSVLAAYQALGEGDEPQFFKHAAIFFASGRETMALTWRILSGEVDALANNAAFAGSAAGAA